MDYSKILQQHHNFSFFESLQDVQRLKTDVKNENSSEEVDADVKENDIILERALTATSDNPLLVFNSSMSEEEIRERFFLIIEMASQGKIA